MEHTQVRTSKTNRALASTGSFSFIRVAENSKSGAWSSEDADNKWTSASNQSPRPFTSYEHNQGIIPKNKGLILDLDVDKKASPAEQSASLDTALTALSELFGSETIDSATINSTAGGGRHVYLELSHSPTAPLKAGSLSRLDGRLRGEVRIAGANAYVLADGSVVDGGHYRNIQGNGTLPTLSEEATERLFAVYAEDGAVDGDDANTAALIAEFEAGEHKRKKSVSKQAFARFQAYIATVSVSVLADIKSKKNGSPRYYHRQIGSLYEAMSHCYSLDVIGVTAVRLGIARTSDGGFPKTSRELTPAELKQQLNYQMKKKGRSAVSDCYGCSRQLSDASTAGFGAADALSSTESVENAETAVIAATDHVRTARARGYQPNEFSRHYVVTDRLALSEALLAAMPKWSRKQARRGTKKKHSTSTSTTRKTVYAATRFAYMIAVAWFDVHRVKGRRNIRAYSAGISEAVEEAFGESLSPKQVRDGLKYLVVAGVLELVQRQMHDGATGGISSIYRFKTSRKTFKKGALKGKRRPKFVDDTATSHLFTALYKGQNPVKPVKYRELSFHAISGEFRAGAVDMTDVYGDGQLVHVYQNAKLHYAEWLWSYGELLGTESEKALAAELKAFVGPIDSAELVEYWGRKVHDFFGSNADTASEASENAVAAVSEDSGYVEGRADHATETTFNEFSTNGHGVVTVRVVSASEGRASFDATDTAGMATRAVDSDYRAAEQSGDDDAEPERSFAERVVSCASAHGDFELVGSDVVDTRSGEAVAADIFADSFTEQAESALTMLMETSGSIVGKTKIANGLARAYRSVKASKSLSAKEQELIVRVALKNGADVDGYFWEQGALKRYLLSTLSGLQVELAELREDEQALLTMLATAEDRREKQSVRDIDTERAKQGTAVTAVSAGR